MLILKKSSDFTYHRLSEARKEKEDASNSASSFSFFMGLPISRDM